jgi:hypothetical protein
VLGVVAAARLVASAGFPSQWESPEVSWSQPRCPELVRTKEARSLEAKPPRGRFPTKLLLSVFFVQVKHALNNKDISIVEYIQQCKIKFEPPKHKRDIAQCANCKKYGHTKNYCHLKPRCAKCADDHLINQCHQKERSSDIRCVLCGGNLPANYKGCMAHKELQKRTHPPLCLKQTLYTQPGATYDQITKQNSYTPTNTEQEPHANQSHQQPRDMQDLKNMMKSFLEQMGIMLNSS